jgi:hypothetical protein
MPKENTGLKSLAYIVTLFIFGFSFYCGFQQIGGFDHSLLVDVAWRQHIGQIPYKDFVCTYPVGFVLGCKLAFALFGPKWSSLILFNSLFSCVTFLWTLYLLNTLFQDKVANLIFAFTFQTMTTMYCSYWWYNPATAIASIIYLLTALNCLRRSDFKSMANYTLALALLALMKPNISAPLIILSFCILLYQKKAIMVYSLMLAFLSDTLIIHLAGMSDYSICKSYLGVAVRIKQFNLFEPTFTLSQRWLNIYVPCFLSLSGLVFCFGKPSIYTILCWMGILVGLIGLATNKELKMIDLSLPLCSIICLLHEQELVNN